MGHMSLSVDVYSNNVFILHYFRDITNFTLHVTACDLAKFFGFNIQLRSQIAYAIQFILQWLTRVIFTSYGTEKRFEQQKWPSMSLKVIGINAIW